MKMKNITLTLTAMLAVCYGIAQAQTFVPPAPLLWLGFDGNLTDKGGSINGHVVSFVGSGCSFISDVANGTAGTQSLYLDGDGSHVIVTNASDLNFNSGVSYTIAAWIKTYTPGVIAAKCPVDSNLIFDDGGTCKTPAWMVFDDGGLTLDVFYSAGEFYGAGVTANNGEWTHVALTYDGSTYTEYTNGVLAVQSDPGQPACDEGRQGEPPWTFTLGWTANSIWPVTGGNVNGPYTGYMDEVAFWNSQLSAGQLGSIYSNGIPTVSVTILQQPADTNVLAGQAAGFTVAAAPFGTTGTLHYQWQTNDVNILGATSPNYLIPATPAEYNGLEIRCIVSIGSIAVATREANLAVTSVSLPSAPLLWLPFEGSLADRGADAGHTASFVLTGAHFTNDVAGSSAGTNSLYLPGGGTCVQISSVSDLNFNTGGGGFTISAWIKTTGVGSIATKCPPPSYIITDTGAGPHTPALFVNDVTLGYDVFYVGGVQTPQLVNDGKWHHVAVTYDGQSTSTLYVDGFQAASGSCAGANEGQSGEPAWDLWLGWTPNAIGPAPGDTPNAPYTGEMDEVAVWSGPLSASQIASVYLNGIPPVSIAFISQPQDTNVLVGDSATFAVAAVPFGTNVSLTYQWQTNGVNIAGATYSSYTLPASALADNGTIFRVVVTAGSISLPSRNITLTVYCAQVALNPANLGYRLVGSTNHPLAIVSFPATLNENTPVSVDLVAANPSVATLQGAVGGKLTLTFPTATTNAQYVPINCLSVGTASFYLTNLVTPRCANIASANLATVTVYQPFVTRTKVETFDTLASTTADGWTGFLNRSGFENYGWSNTGNASGTNGEAGGIFVRTNSRSYFADTTIGTLTLNDYITAAGTVMIVTPPQNNENVYVTYFNTNDAWDNANNNFLGVEFTEGPANGPNGRFATVLGFADNSIQYGTPDPGDVLNSFGVAVSWDFEYDPTGGPTGNGQVICNYSSYYGSASITNIVSAEQRVIGATFNAFGLATRDLPFQGAPGEYYLDNVSYTVGGVVKILNIQMLPGNQVRLTFQSAGTTHQVRQTSSLSPTSWSMVPGVTYSGPTNLIWTATFTAPPSPAFLQIIANPSP